MIKERGIKDRSNRCQFHLKKFLKASASRVLTWYAPECADMKGAAVAVQYVDYIVFGPIIAWKNDNRRNLLNFE